jgi:hypothetical protein
MPNRSFRQSQDVVDDQNAVHVSTLRAFPQTVVLILWSGLTPH